MTLNSEKSKDKKLVLPKYIHPETCFIQIIEYDMQSKNSPMSRFRLTYPLICATMCGLSRQEQGLTP